MLLTHCSIISAGGYAKSEGSRNLRAPTEDWPRIELWPGRGIQRRPDEQCRVSGIKAEASPQKEKPEGSKQVPLWEGQVKNFRTDVTGKKVY